MDASAQRRSSIAMTRGSTAVTCATKLDSSRFTRSGDAAPARFNTDANGDPQCTRAERSAYQVGAVSFNSRVMTSFSPARAGRPDCRGTEETLQRLRDAASRRKTSRVVPARSRCRK